MNTTTLKLGQLVTIPGGPFFPDSVTRVTVADLLPRLPRPFPARLTEGIEEAATTLSRLAAAGRRSMRDTTDEHKKVESFNDALADTYSDSAEEAAEYLYLAGEPIAAALVDEIFHRASRDHVPANLRAMVQMQLVAIDAARRLAPLVPTEEQLRLHSMKQAALLD